MKKMRQTLKSRYVQYSSLAFNIHFKWMTIKLRLIFRLMQNLSINNIEIFFTAINGKNLRNLSTGIGKVTVYLKQSKITTFHTKYG